MKKVLSILLVLVLCTSLMALTVSAAGNASLKATSAEVAVGGGTATIEVSLSSNPGVMAMQIVPSVPAGFSISMSGTGMGGGVWTTGKNAFWDNGSDSTYTGKILTVTVTVDASVDAGEYKITFSGSGSNYDEEDVSFSGASATIKVVCDHSWGAWTETKPATCDVDGEETRTCSKCGETETKPIPATGHDWDDGVVTTPATCGDPGVKTFTCQNDSSHTKTEVIDPTGNHTGSYVKIDGNDKQHKVTCTVCGKDGDLEDHSWDKGTVTTPATCGDPGVKTFTCTKCGYEKTEEIAATGKHTTTVKEIDGNDKQHKVECSVCDYEALEDHKYDKGKVTTPATCLPGQKTYTCSECGHEKFEVIAGDPDKHDRNSVNSWDKVDDKYHQGTCECGETIKEEHTWGEWKVTVPHDEANKKDGEKRRECEYCDAYQTKVIPWDIDIEPDTGDITSQVVMTGAVVLVVMMGAVALVFKRKTAK